jgi:glycosyltransferase involved in cell wall biosynthesis
VNQFIEGGAPPRTLVVCEPGLDGVFRHAEGLVRFLVQKGMRVDFAYSSVRGSDRLKDLVKSIGEAGGHVLDLRVGNAPQVGDVPALRRLMSLVRHSGPRVIHCHSSKAGILGRAAGAVAGVPSVYTPNAYYGMGKSRGARTALFNGLERCFASCGHTINVSEDEAAFAREQLGVRRSQQTVIPNAVDTGVFKPATTEEKRQWQHAKGLPANAIVLGSLGRLSYQKDPLTLYRSFEIVARKHSNAYLAHLGTGALEKECEEWIQRSGLGDRIVRMDYSPEPSDFYRGLDGFVLSSRYEGLSFAVLEALATDLPLVLTDVPGNRDFLRLGLSHVWSAPAEAPAALATAMEACLLDLGLRRPSNHRVVALERFSEEVCFGKTLDLYQQIANPQRRQHTLAFAA